MLVLDKPRPFRSATLTIPLYHRGQLSLLPGTKVWLCLLPGTGAPGRLPEIIISPIGFNAWSDLWRITATLHEKVGVVHQVLRVLHAWNINILAAESSSIERQEFHYLELLVDASKHVSILDGDSRTRSRNITAELPDLKRAILAECLMDIALWPSGEPRLKIRRVKGLYQALEAFQQAQTSHARKPRYGPSTDSVVVGDNGQITLPKEMVSTLYNIYSRRNQPPVARDNGLSYLFVSDSKDRYLRTYFLGPSDPVLSVNIEHEDRIGALARITHSLQQQGFNILTSLSRLHVHGRRAQYELVLQPPTQLGKREDKIRSELERILSTKELISGYKLAVSYQLNYKSPIGFQTLHIDSDASAPNSAARSTTEEAASRNDRRQPTGTVEEKLERVTSALAQTVGNQVGATPADALRYALARKLLDEERTLQGRFTPRRVLFISCTSDDETRLSKVVEAAQDVGFEVVHGFRLGDARTVREGVISLIEQSTCFLGLWTEDGGIGVNDRYWPSPWLHWEVGVAEARGKRPRLLVSQKIHPSAWQKLYPEVPNTIFRPGEFSDRLGEVIEIIAAEHA